MSFLPSKTKNVKANLIKKVLGAGSVYAFTLGSEALAHGLAPFFTSTKERVFTPNIRY